MPIADEASKSVKILLVEWRRLQLREGQPEAPPFYVLEETLSRVHLFATPWTIARQAPLSTGFSRQEEWSGLPCLPPGDLPNFRDQTQVSCIAGRFFTVWATREALRRLKGSANIPLEFYLIFNLYKTIFWKTGTFKCQVQNGNPIEASNMLHGLLRLNLLVQPAGQVKLLLDLRSPGNLFKNSISHSSALWSRRILIIHKKKSQK